MKTIKSVGSTRPIVFVSAIALLSMTATLAMCLSLAVGSGWRVAWLVTAAIFGLILLLSLYQLLFKRRFELIDFVLLTMVIGVIIIFEPFVAAVRQEGFPLPFGDTNDNSVAASTGLIVSAFFSFYTVGRLIAQRVASFDRALAFRGVISSSSVFVFSLIPLAPLALFGGQDIIANIQLNLLGRQSGYVAFSEGAVGTSSPILLLMAQALPVSAVLNFFLASTAQRRTLKAAHLAMFVVILFVSASLGGRSWIVIVVGTAAITYLSISRRALAEQISIALVGLMFLLSVLGWQMQNRHEGLNLDNTSGLFGFNINREVAFVAKNFDERNFVQGGTVAEKILLPVPSYIFLVVTNPVPRMIWPSKPIEPSFAVVNLMRTGYDGLATGSNVTLSIPGRAFANFGMSGVIQAGFALGLLASVFCRQLRQSDPTKLGHTAAVFSLVLIAANFRELQAGKWYPVLWFYFFIFIHKFKTA